MNAHYATIEEPATPEYVLAVLRDWHRQQCRFDPSADPTAVLSFESTVAEWRDACHLVGWRNLGHAYNQLWGMNCSDAEWKAVLEPARERKLAEVCRLIARNTSRSCIRPARLFGCTCAPAGAFLTIRALLHQAGADPARITPSTPLAPYTRRYLEVFLVEIARLAPGSLPPVCIRHPVYDSAIWGLLVGWLCLLGGCCGGFPLFTVAGVLIAAMSYALTWVAARWLLPRSVEFGCLRTFRDLALVVAQGAPT